MRNVQGIWQLMDVIDGELVPTCRCAPATYMLMCSGYLHVTDPAARLLFVQSSCLHTPAEAWCIYQGSGVLFILSLLVMAKSNVVGFRHNK